MIKKLFFILLCILISNSGNAGDCDQYKKNIDINFQRKEHDIHIKSSDKELWPVGGFVEVKPFNTFTPDISYVFNGKYFCVFLNSVDASVGFEDFVITIDKKYKSGSCEYDAILEHENHHIKDAINAMDNVYDDLKSALKKAVDSVNPIYVENPDDVPRAFDEINQKITKDKKLQDLLEKFQQQIEHDRNVLDSEPDSRLIKCTIDKVNDAFEKYFKDKK